MLIMPVRVAILLKHLSLRYYHAYIISTLDFITQKGMYGTEAERSL